MTERRFNEVEVAAIFERATEAREIPQRELPSGEGEGEGLTLAELKEIGREVGIAPDLIVHAAQMIDQGGRPTSRQFIGIPIGVGRTIELDRRLTEDEWERLVVDLRETFDARGVVRREGSLRQWTNGNLQALLEPTETGQRLRLRTVKGDARSLMIGGLGMFGAAAAAVVLAVLRGGDAGTLSSLWVLALGGAGMFGLGAMRLPRWARLRQQQMEGVAERLALVAKSQVADDSRSER
ncbi:MAG: hypothetical protein ACT4P6_00480 [Gemmatimonadaceae bacterium]